MKKRVHEFLIRVRFDKPCSASHALRETKDCVHGDFYPFQADLKKDPGQGWIKNIKHLPTNRQRTSR